MNLSFGSRTPDVAVDAWIAPSAVVIGAVSVAARASIWFGAVLRGDLDQIRIGAGTNVQDGTVMHADPGSPVDLGAGVTVGHRAVIHGCTVGDHSLIGMGAVLLNGVRIGEGSLVAAGAVVLEGTVIPPNSLVAGVPGKVRRTLSPEERDAIRHNAQVYDGLRAEYARGQEIQR